MMNWDKTYKSITISIDKLLIKLKNQDYQTDLLKIIALITNDCRNDNLSIKLRICSLIITNNKT